MRVPHSLGIAALALVLAAPLAPAQEGASGGKTFKADLYFTPRAEAGAGLEVERLSGPADLGVWVDGTPQKLQSVTVTPGQDSEVVRHEGLTFRISGLYRGPQKDRMFLRVRFDQGGEAAVKEFLAGLDENVVLTYPVRNGTSGTIVVVLTPTG